MNRKKSILLTLIGTMITGFAIGSFLTPNVIIGGGASGISTILYHKVGITPGVSFFLINLVFLIAGFKILGKEFVFKTLLGITLLSIFTEIFSHIQIQVANLILAVLFGGALYGIGIGIAFAAGASTGGTDIIGRIIQTKFPTVPIGRMLLIVDGIIILVSLIIFKSVELVLFGILALFISSYSIDLIINKLNVSKIAFVITDKGEEISKYLISTSPRGVTLVDVHGAYSDTDKKMLFCALKESETEAFQKKILAIDPESFTVFAESQRIKGNGFYIYK